MVSWNSDWAPPITMRSIRRRTQLLDALCWIVSGFCGSFSVSASARDPVPSCMENALRVICVKSQRARLFYPHALDLISALIEFDCSLKLQLRLQLRECLIINDYAIVCLQINFHGCWSMTRTAQQSESRAPRRYLNSM